jgi:hypothetical protein
MRRKGYFWIYNCSKHFFSFVLLHLCFLHFSNHFFLLDHFCLHFCRSKKIKIKPRSAQSELQRGIFKSKLCHFFANFIVFCFVVLLQRESASVNRFKQRTLELTWPFLVLVRFSSRLKKNYYF